MWTLEHFDMEYEVVSADDYDKLDALYDTIILAPGDHPRADRRPAWT